MAVTAPAAQAHHAGPYDHRPIWRRPNLLRAFIFFALGWVFAYVLVGVIRTAMHESHPWHTWNAIVLVGLISGPMFFLVGLGAFHTGSTGPPAGPRAPRTTPATAPTRGRTTSAS